MAGYVTRFAPSPTGPLHLGHAFSALTAWERARNGTFLLRIEDLDQSRSRPEWTAQIYDDLHWLGLRWPQPVLHQSTRQHAYDAALQRLSGMGLTYVCTCTRADIRAALSAPQEGPDGLVYPGTCRHLNHPSGAQDVIRLNMAAALRVAGPLHFDESGTAVRPDPQQMIDGIGDVILARRGMGAAYHLAVVVDDAHQNVTEAVRGADLLPATPIHVLIAKLLGLPQLTYHHHRLIRDESGKRLAKRDDARAIATFRAEGATPQDIRRMIGL